MNPSSPPETPKMYSIFALLSISQKSKFLNILQSPKPWSPSMQLQTFPEYLKTSKAQNRARDEAKFPFIDSH